MRIADEKHIRKTRMKKNGPDIFETVFHESMKQTLSGSEPAQSSLVSRLYCTNVFMA